jgi:hypothetical protein
VAGIRLEVIAVLTNLPGDKWLLALRMLGGGSCLVEYVLLGAQDRDFVRDETLVGDTKAVKDHSKDISRHTEANRNT